MLQHCQVDRVVCLRFNSYLAGLTADEFIQRILLDGLAVKYLVVGDDFRFGKQRAGNFSLLEQAGNTHGFPVAKMRTFNVGDQRVLLTR